MVSSDRDILRRQVRSIPKSFKLQFFSTGQIYRPVFKSYRLNERMYGDLEGKSKVQTCIDMGEKEVAAFRTGLYARPPPMSVSNPYWHGNETKYK